MMVPRSANLAKGSGWKLGGHVDQRAQKPKTFGKAEHCKPARRPSMISGETVFLLALIAFLVVATLSVAL